METTNYTALSRLTGPLNTAIAEEPVLDIQDIQGNAIPGFNKPYQYALCFQITDISGCKSFLKQILPHISTMEEVLAFRRLYRARRKRLGFKPGNELTATWVNIAFSYPGLDKLSNQASSFKSQAFKTGMAGRSSLLGDPTNSHDKGSPQNWIIGSNEKIPDIFVIVGSDQKEYIHEKVGAVKKMAAIGGLYCIYDEEMSTIESDGITGQEHFGFKDGISQPGVRGRLSEKPADYLQERYVAEDVLPDSLLYGYPGQFLCWPGEFLFGYPGQTQDPLVPGLIKMEGPDWTKNGSYLVFRRLRQDVRLFWEFMTGKALELSKEPAFKDMNAEKLAAMMLGRWPSGAPFARIQDKDDKMLGGEQLANNYFRFTSDSCPVKLVNGYEDKFPQSKADPIGLTCPMSSHIRKVNTRDSSNDDGGTLASFNRRLLRRGLPFGPKLDYPLDPKYPDPVEGKRGLLFISYQTSIEDQFEFLNNRWMSNRFAPRSPGGDDVVIGSNGNFDQNGERYGQIFGAGAIVASVITKDQWITPTGGEYFFSPSISAIETVLAI